MIDIRDQLSRPLRDLRISVTDRCNFRCTYCMPAEIFGPGHAFLKDPQLMSFAELARILRAFVSLGVEKIRLTGGEPLLRADVPELIRFIKTELRVPDVALTTNGWLLEKYAPALRAAGLDRLNVSLDSLDPEIFGRMNGQGFSPDRVIRGIDAARRAGFPVKLNMVVQRSVNDREITSLAQWSRERGLTLRFIEYMDAGNHNGWQRDEVVPAKEIVDTLNSRWPIEPLVPAYRGEVAARYRYIDGGGEIGLINAVTEPFCRDCNRARLSADGRLHTCLFTALGHDVLGTLRSGATDETLQKRIASIWGARTDRYSDERAERLVRGELPPKAEMSYLGG
jgi:GTP 3',8-cyclase